MYNLPRGVVIRCVCSFAFMASGLTAWSADGAKNAPAQPEPSQYNSAGINYDLITRTLPANLTPQTAVCYDSRTNQLTAEANSFEVKSVQPACVGTEILPNRAIEVQKSAADPTSYTPSYSMIFESRSTSWAWAADYSWSGFQTELSTYSSFRLEHVDTYGKNVFYYAGTWTGDGIGWAYMLNYTNYSTFLSLLNAWPNGTTRYRPSQLTTYLYRHDGTMNYGAVAVADNLGFAWTINGSNQSTFTTWINNEYSGNRRLVDIRCYTDASGTLYYSAVSKDATFAQQAAWNISYSTFQSDNTTYVGQGYRLVSFHQYMSGGTLYCCALWNKDGIGGAWAVNLTNVSTLQSQATTYINAGYRPMLIDVFDNDPVAIDVAATQPSKFELQQNFPNPFNPSTTIRYGLEHRTAVSLNVYNALGQRVATLANDTEEPGYHEVKFDASGLASGIYFYQIVAGTYTETKKLVLMR